MLSPEDEKHCVSLVWHVLSNGHHSLERVCRTQKRALELQKALEEEQIERGIPEDKRQKIYVTTRIVLED